MSDILNKQITIKLNRSWCTVGLMTVREAVVFLASEHNGEKPGFAMDFETAVDENGERTLVYCRPVAFEEWVKLPVREGDLSINTSSGPMRVPLVVICAKYNKVPTRNTRWSTGNVYTRDGYICAYSGEKLSRAQASVDHILPRSRGGKDEFGNTVTCHKRINVMKGARTPEEAGLKLLYEPKVPKARPVAIRKQDAPLPDQRPFLLD